MADEINSNKFNWIIIFIFSIVSVFLGVDLQHIVDQTHQQPLKQSNQQRVFKPQDSILQQPTTLATFSLTNNQG